MHCLSYSRSLEPPIEAYQIYQIKLIDNWLPFPKVEVLLSKGEYKTKWLRKSSNKNILVHFLSTHPTRTKKAVVGNMFEAAERVAPGGEERPVSIRMAQKVYS